MYLGEVIEDLIELEKEVGYEATTYIRYEGEEVEVFDIFIRDLGTCVFEVVIE